MKRGHIIHRPSSRTGHQVDFFLSDFKRGNCELTHQHFRPDNVCRVGQTLSCFLFNVTQPHSVIMSGDIMCFSIEQLSLLP